MIATQTRTNVSTGIENHINLISAAASKQANHPTSQDLEDVLSMGNRFINEIISASPPLITSQKDIEARDSFKKSHPNFDPKIFKMQTEDLSQYLHRQPKISDRGNDLHPYNKFFQANQLKGNVIDEIRNSKVISQNRGSKIAGYKISIQEKIQEAFKLLQRISNYHFS